MEQELLSSEVPAVTPPAASPKLNFDTIEQVRKAMLLTMQNMADLMGVSRVTYYNWVKGNPLKHVNAVKAKVLMRKLAVLVTDHNWPTAKQRQASRNERFEMLLELLKVLDEEATTQ